MLLIILFCTVTGARKSAEYNTRTKLLEQLVCMVDLIETEIRYSGATLCEIFTKISGRVELNGLSFITECLAGMEEGEAFPAAFRKSVENWRCPLKSDDRQLIFSFGGQLGKSDGEGQQSNCKLHSSLFKKAAEAARAERDKNGKLPFKLGVCAGLGIALMFI